MFAEVWHSLQEVMNFTFDLSPPPSDAGKQFRKVADQVCPPPSDLHDVYARTISDNARVGKVSLNESSVGTGEVDANELNAVPSLEFP